MLCIGHRGARGYEPENTLRSVRRALEMGADGVEIDVHLLEGELIVLHDARLERTTNGRGPIRGHTLAQVRALDAGGGERVPLLREVLDAVEAASADAIVNVEMKGRGTALPVEAVIRDYVLKRGWPVERFLVSSFHRAELRLLQNSGVRLGILFARSASRFRPLANWLDAWSINVPLRQVNACLVRRAHENGQKVLVYTVNTPAALARVHGMGVDGVFTDFPDRCAPVFERLSSRPV